MSNNRTFDLSTDFKPAGPGWALHEYYLDEHGELHTETTPLAGWCITAEHKTDRWGDLQDPPLPGRGIVPAIWSNTENRLIDKEEIDLATNVAAFVTGPGQAPPHPDLVQERFDDKQAARERAEARSAS